jgi:hypothetical protein
MMKQLSKAEVENHIRGRLIVLVQLGADHGIDIERLMREALDACDIEPG